MGSTLILAFLKAAIDCSTQALSKESQLHSRLTRSLAPAAPINAVPLIKNEILQCLNLK